MGSFPKAATVACCAAYCSLLAAEGAIHFSMPIVTFGIVASGVLAFFGAVMLHKSESQRESAERELQNCRTRLHRVSSQLDEIVISEGEDAGVILLSSDSPTHYDADKRCQVYDNEYFSPLGKALVSVASVARGDGAIL